MNTPTEPDPAPAQFTHQWDRDGERCLLCGAKDWMPGKCTGPKDPAPAQTAREWVEPHLIGIGVPGWGRRALEEPYALELADRADRAEAELAAKKEELADEWRKGWRRSCMRIAAKLVSIGCPSDGVVDGVDWLVAEHDRLREALGWYAEQARLCRLIHSEGDAGRNALSADGGQRARTALNQTNK